MFQAYIPTAYTKIEPQTETYELAGDVPVQHDEVYDHFNEGSCPNPKQKPSKSRLGWVSQTWKFTIRSGAFAGTLILLINVITLLVIYLKFDNDGVASVIFEGSCKTTNLVSIGSHVFINVLSTILLAYSNYSMQCVSAPTRKEIDKAHKKRRWLSIGTPTIRNLLFVSPWKTGLWIFLWISSFPLHLLWNSTVFSTLAYNNYFAISVTSNLFMDTTASTALFNESLIATAGLPSSVSDVVEHFQNLATQQSTKNLIERLSVEDCIKAYATDAMTARRNVLLVVDAINVTSSEDPVISAYSAGERFPFSWMCDASFDANSFINGGGWKCRDQLLGAVSAGRKWIPGQSEYSVAVYGAQDGNPVQFCYSESISPQDQHCKVSVVPIFLVAVIACNVMKIIGFVLCLRTTQKNPPLLTTGDAIASFIESPDSFTRGRCLASKYDYDKGLFRKPREWRPRPGGVFDVWAGGRYRWGKAVRGIQWTFYMLCVSTVIILAGAFFGTGGVGWGTTEAGSSVWSLGIGKPHKNFYVIDPYPKPLLTSFLAANWIQLLVSYLYLFLSNMFTTMAAMAEFCAFSQSSRGLRVSNPQKDSEQKSTFFLSLPYRYAIPLMACVATLHYFVSQMVFLARIDMYDAQGNFDPSTSMTNVFFSPLAMYFAVSLGSAIVLILIVLGIFKKYPSTPLAGCCSASIAASCQPVVDSEFPADLALRKLKWGVVKYDSNGVGHATFSADEVEPLQVDHGYA